MKILFAALIGLVLSAGAAQADTFDAITCKSDIPKALTGKSFGSGNESAMQFEAHHKAIGLKDNWAEIINDNLQSVSLTICGHEYHVLVDDKNAMRDVVLFPPHSRAMPGFSGVCRVNGKETPWGVTAVLDNKAGVDPNPDHHYSVDDKTELAAVAAWRIDEKTLKFIPVPVAGMRCARSGLFTQDGGT